MEEELSAQISLISKEIEQIKRDSKQKEIELKSEIQELSNEKKQLIVGVKARIGLIDMIKRDIERICLNYELKLVDNQFDSQFSGIVTKKQEN